jgi:hypothetical protein
VIAKFFPVEKIREVLEQTNRASIRERDLPAGKRTKGAWYRQWRLVSLDGSTLDAADTAENDQAFGRPGSSRGSSAFPKMRFVALLENGTHVLWGAHMDRSALDGVLMLPHLHLSCHAARRCNRKLFFDGCTSVRHW